LVHTQNGELLDGSVAYMNGNKVCMLTAHDGVVSR
jgi:hypothetical protein